MVDTFKRKPKKNGKQKKKEKMGKQKKNEKRENTKKENGVGGIGEILFPFKIDFLFKGLRRRNKNEMVRNTYRQRLPIWGLWYW